MADISQKPQRTGFIPPWRDSRILNVLLQIAFVILLALGLNWLWTNISTNIGQLGEAQFICRDGTTSYRCAFDFLNSDAQFDIQESVIQYSPQDSFWRAVAVGALNTLKVSVFGIILATALGTITGIARLSGNWLISSVARWYVDLLRNTPLLLQLVFIYFVVLLGLPGVGEAISVFNLPIYLSQRGVNFPKLVYMSSFAVWLAFIVLGLIQAQIVWFFLRRREEQTGKPSNRLLWAMIAFFVVAGVGWFGAGNTSDEEAMLVSRVLRVREFDELAAVVERRLGLEDLGDLEQARAAGDLTGDDVDAAAVSVCAIEESPSEVNLTSQLSRMNIPFVVDRFDRPDQAIDAYAAGECDLFVARRSVLAAERDLLEDSAAQLIVGVPETPVRLSTPRLAGFNFIGGGKMSTEFTALLVGLVLFTGAFIAEIVRAGIQSVPKGQSEAARALGLSETQRLQLVVLPQALRVIVPPLTSQYLNLAKNSSLALAVAYPDLYRTIDTMINQSGRSIQLILILAGIYLSISLTISFFLNWYNRRIELVER